MSKYKLVKENKKDNKGKKKLYYFFIVCAIISLCLACSIWLKILSTSKQIRSSVDAMVLNEDYFYEDVEIVRKDYEEYYPNPDTTGTITNYYLYYNGIEKLFVDKATYTSVKVGDSIKAYTKDHSHYYYNKDNLAGLQYKDNEMFKAFGVVLIIAIPSFLGLSWVYKQ